MSTNFIWRRAKIFTKSPILQTDRKTRYVSEKTCKLLHNNVQRTCTKSPERSKVMDVRGYSWHIMKVHSSMTRSTLVCVHQYSDDFPLRRYECHQVITPEEEHLSTMFTSGSAEIQPRMQHHFTFACVLTFSTSDIPYTDSHCISCNIVDICTMKLDFFQESIRQIVASGGNNCFARSFLAMNIVFQVVMKKWQSNHCTG